MAWMTLVDAARLVGGVVEQARQTIIDGGRHRRFVAMAEFAHGGERGLNTQDWKCPVDWSRSTIAMPWRWGTSLATPEPIPVGPSPTIVLIDRDTFEAYIASASLSEVQPHIGELQMDASPLKRRLPTLSGGDAESWYRDRLKGLRAAGKRSTREEDRAAAKQQGIPTKVIDELRREHAPTEWQERGRPKSAKK